MPPLAVVEASNAAFSPNYIPVAVFVGGTSGVGQAMAEALARQTQGRAHIIIVGRNATAAAEILAGFPKPKPTETEDGWAHEFVACEAESMASVRTVCAALNARLKRINFLVITAGGPQANSLTTSCVTSEGLNATLAMRCVDPHTRGIHRFLIYLPGTSCATYSPRSWFPFSTPPRSSGSMRTS
jgi:hypothetical protein